jgi:hypothetical protein
MSSGGHTARKLKSRGLEGRRPGGGIHAAGVDSHSEAVEERGLFGQPGHELSETVEDSLQSLRLGDEEHATDEYRQRYLGHGPRIHP